MTEEETPWNPQHLAVVMKGSHATVRWQSANREVLLNLREADLTGAPLNFADLTGADLTGADLSRADLTGAKLSRTDLTRAKLSRADLTGADLTSATLVLANVDDANLSRADLNYANLRHANLRRANLSGANLTNAGLVNANITSANLTSADLTDADLSEATLWFAVLVETDLTGTILMGAKFLGTTVTSDITAAHCLDEVNNLGPCAIAAHVLLRPTKNPWPISFLRGVGLSDHEIEHALTIAVSANPISFYSSFISYSTKDDAFAVKLHDTLQASGVRCWLDKHEILPGDNFAKKINEGIRLWDKVLLLCTKDSLNSWWVKREVTRALEKEQRLEKERGHEVLAIIPLDVDGYLFTDECENNFEFAADLRKRHAARFKGWKRKKGLFDEQVERVVKSLRADDGARPGPPPPKL